MAIRIPDPQKKPLAKLADLTDAQIEELDRALRSASPAISPRALADNLRAHAGLPASDLPALLSVLVSLAITRRRHGDSVVQIAAEVAQAAEAQGVAKLTAQPDSLDTLERKLALLLADNEVIEITARAADVFFAHEQLFQTARVLSDVRPIFSSEDASSPAAGMVVHNLELTVGERGERDRHYVAMNVHDLYELRRVVDRAIAKDGALRGLIAAAGITYVEDVPSEHQRAR